MLKNLRFKLNFDDPRLADEKQLTLTGDRTQLESLTQAVETYVQTFLARSPARLNAALLAPIVDPELPTEAISSPNTPQESSEVLAPSSLHGIYLQPNGLIAHNLHLGSLATPESGPIISLTVLQLFDLATALDEYATDVVALPTLTRPSRFVGVPPSLRFAASLILALGITTFSVKLMGDWYGTSEPTLTATSESQEGQQLVLRPAPTVLSSPESGEQALPPPPPVGALTPTTPDETIPIPSTTVPDTPSFSEETPELASPEGSESQIPVFDIPSEPVAKEPAPQVLESSPSETAQAQLPEIPELGSTDNSSGEPPQTLARSAQSNSARADASQETATAFDRIPQVAEVRNYFQQRWTPPDSLTSAIEYSLLLSPDGTIDQVIPLGEAAATFIDRTDIPLRGEPFVSPVEGGRQPKIRLVLTPEGEVNAFLEAMN